MFVVVDFQSCTLQLGVSLAVLCGSAGPSGTVLFSASLWWGLSCALTAALSSRSQERCGLHRLWQNEICRVHIQVCQAFRPLTHLSHRNKALFWDSSHTNCHQTPKLLIHLITNDWILTVRHRPCANKMMTTWSQSSGSPQSGGRDSRMCLAPCTVWSDGLCDMQVGRARRGVCEQVSPPYCSSSREQLN